MNFIENSFVSPRGFAITGFVASFIGFMVAADSRQLGGEAFAGLGLCIVGAACLLGAARLKSHSPPPGQGPNPRHRQS